MKTYERLTGEGAGGLQGGQWVGIVVHVHESFRQQLLVVTMETVVPSNQPSLKTGSTLISPLYSYRYR